MKKAFFLTIVFLVVGTTLTFAQLQEVKGVETKWTTYTGNQYEVSTYYSYSGRTVKFTKDLYFGYLFHNRNTYSITVESELWLGGDNYNRDKVVDTKSFVLDADEKYIWKQETNGNFRVYRYIDGSGTPPALDKVDGNYYVKFKAYKNE